MGERKAGGRAGRKQVLIILRKGVGAVEVFLGGRIRWKRGDQFWRGGGGGGRGSRFLEIVIMCFTSQLLFDLLAQIEGCFTCCYCLLWFSAYFLLFLGFNSTLFYYFITRLFKGTLMHI